MEALRIGPADGHGSGQAGLGKAFFFEKKKQKTFGRLSRG
jgi:hypothetical protein